MPVVVVYFLYLAATALTIARVPFTRRLLALAASGVVLLVVWMFGMPHVLPFGYLVAGYWVPALLVGQIAYGLERRLAKFDARLFGEAGVARVEARFPRPVLEYLEATYLLCYAVPPVGWAILVAGGHDDRLDVFWWTVLLSAYACYGPLPWALTRAPRSVEPLPAASRLVVRQLNVGVLGRVSVQWNTFPSGHTAVSLATAFAVWPAAPAAALVLALLSCSIAAGSVVGRYHYTADAIAGALVAVAAYITATAVHAA